MKLSHLGFYQNILRFVLVLVLLSFTSNAKPGSLVKKKVSAVFVFGDSTSDPGNNNYIKTAFKGNFPPYGRDFTDQIPTGRFSNGFLTSDFIARYVGVKDNVPPYLDPSLSIEDIITGVSFASAGSGYDPLTPKTSNVISLPKQLEYFKEYQGRLIASIGKEKTTEIINDALYLVAAGTNDFVVNYFLLPIRRKKYTLPNYMDYVLKTQLDFLQELWDQGALRIAVAGLPPMGCLPVVITLYSDNAIFHRGCIDFFSSVAQKYNLMLQTQLNFKQFKLTSYGARITYLDIYVPLSDAIIGRKYGFEEARVGCCGTGILETGILCNHHSYVCPDASKYVFWDSIHPTQRMYDIVFQASRSTIDYLIKD